MTVLERKRRRQQRLASLRNPLGILGKLGNMRQRLIMRNQKKTRPSLVEPLGPLEIDSITYCLMKKEVLDRIASGDGKSCSLFDAIAAMRGSPEVVDTFAENPTDILGLGFLYRLSGGKEGRKMKRRYQLMNAFEELEAMPSASEYRVSCWEDVEEACRHILSFPAESSTVLEDVAPENPVERLVQRLKVEQAAKVESILNESQKRWKEMQFASLTSEQELDKADKASADLLAEEYQKRFDRLQSDELRLSEERLLKDEREREAEERASQLLRELTPEEQEMVREALYQDGSDDDVIAKSDSDIVYRKNMHSLQPGQWLSDEVISFFLAMLTKRDEELCRQEPGRKRSHFFKSFFMTKLLNEGHSNPAIAGTYEYRNVKRWSKKVPGKDIFNLDKIVFPINVGEVHWVCAVAFMEEKRIQYYDSFGGDGMHFLECILRYIKDEHEDKKKAPLPDEDEWRLIPCERDTPRQRNGYDCGVFTCMFADFISKGCPLVFGQEHVNQCRERIALSILQGAAIM